MPGNFVRSALISGAEGLIHELGGRTERIAARAGVPVAALRDPDIPLPGRAAYAFLECAAEALDCPSFGLLLGVRAPLAAVVGPLWVLLRSATTLRQMFVDLAENFDVYTSVATLAVETLPDGAVLAWSSTAGQTDSEVQMAEYAMGVLCSEVHRQGFPRWQSRHIEFRHAAPKDLRDHHRWLGTHLSFNRDRNTTFIENALLDQPLHPGRARARALVGTLLRRDEEVLDPDLAMRVESIIRAVLPFAPCNVGDVSRALGLPPRTLQHRLEAGGDSFKQIRDRVRADLALKYLAHSHLALAEIAEILGYSELSAFSRAFTRWHGRPPSALRAR